MSGLSDLTRLGGKFTNDVRSNSRKAWAPWLGGIILLLVVLYFIQSETGFPAFDWTIKAVSWIFSLLWSIIEWIIKLF